MNIVVLRWPVIEISGTGEDRKVRRASMPLAKIPCTVDADAKGPIVAKGVVFVHFPRMGGMYEFRLSTGSGVTEKMRDYVIADKSLEELRVEANRRKQREAIVERIKR